VPLREDDDVHAISPLPANKSQRSLVPGERTTLTTSGGAAEFNVTRDRRWT
jgi:hypothetical protein